MQRDIYGFKSFYNTQVGQIVRRIMSEKIRRFWPDARGMRVMGCGYAVPYLRMFKNEAERVFALMPASQGVHYWPEDEQEKNLSCAVEEFELPIESSSVDRILLIHDLEFFELLNPSLQEFWRVLKPGGRLLVVVPNRSGLWSSADWSPFGLGSPYSEGQICHHLRENCFVHERSERALFFPPLRYALVLKCARIFEIFGSFLFPFFAGVHMVEASKQVFANTTAERTHSRLALRSRGGLGRPVPQSYSSLERDQ